MWTIMQRVLHGGQYYSTIDLFNIIKTAIVTNKYPELKDALGTMPRDATLQRQIRRLVEAQDEMCNVLPGMVRFNLYLMHDSEPSTPHQDRREALPPAPEKSPPPPSKSPPTPPPAKRLKTWSYTPCPVTTTFSERTPQPYNISGIDLFRESGGELFCDEVLGQLVGPMPDSYFEGSTSPSVKEFFGSFAAAPFNEPNQEMVR